MGYYPNRAIEEQEAAAQMYVDRTYPSRRETLEYYLEDLTGMLERLDEMRPHDPMHPQYDKFFCSTGRYRYYEVMWAEDPAPTVEDVLAAIAEVKDLIWMLDCEEKQQVCAEEMVEKEEDSIIPGQIDLIAFLPPRPAFAPSYAGKEC